MGPRLPSLWVSVIDDYLSALPLLVRKLMHTEAFSTLQGKPIYFGKKGVEEEWIATFLMLGLKRRKNTFYATNKDGDEYVIGSTSWMSVDELNKYLLRK